MKGRLVDGHVVVEEESAASKLVQRGFGRKRERGLHLSLVEALYLLEKRKLEVVKGGRSLSLEELLGEQEEGLLTRYAVYRDLRERGYVVKTGFKFGTHFRVYERGAYPKEHSRYLVHAVREGDAISFTELARAVRLAQGVRKKLLFAVVDDEEDITYYAVERVTP
ncbi:MAG: tRNA-intron lyase [Euryarchaeota archaeon]|nr:tRNA-intron lyase [Euryarchaeota archaeon]